MTMNERNARKWSRRQRQQMIEREYVEQFWLSRKRERRAAIVSGIVIGVMLVATAWAILRLVAVKRDLAEQETANAAMRCARIEMGGAR